jgi:hypothetical protein
MAWRFEGRVAIVVHTAKSPSNLEWQRFLTEAAERASGAPKRVVVVSHGGTPDGDQRKQLMRAFQSDPAPTAILSKSGLMRAVTSALSFFNPKMMSAGLDEGDRAFAFLGLTGDERVAVQRARSDLESELGLRGSVQQPE